MTRFQSIVCFALMSFSFACAADPEASAPPAPRSSWSVSVAEGGYAVSLPAAFLSAYDEGDRVELSLTDDARGETSVTGQISFLADSQILVATSGKLAFTDSTGATKLGLVRTATCPYTSDDPEAAQCSLRMLPYCAGCTAKTVPWDPEGHICYCGAVPPIWKN